MKLTLRRALTTLLLTALAIGWNETVFAESIHLWRTKASGICLLVLTVDMNDPHVKVTGMLAEHGGGNSETFARMVARSHPTAAVTGTFFDVASATPLGDIVVNGSLAHRGGLGTGLCINTYNECKFVQPPRRYARMDWKDFDFVCCSGPRLVHRSRAEVHPGPEGFHDRHMLSRNSRLAVGMTKNNKLLFVATRQPVQLSSLAKALKHIGCIEAINLDAGSSLGFYHKGRMIARPGRRLTNAILIYNDADRYERFKSRLTPAPRMAKQ